MTETPRDIANMAESMVITMPQRVLALLLQTAVAGDEGADDAPQVDFVCKAKDFLTDEFAPRFEYASGGLLPQPLREALDVLCASISQLHDALRSVLANRTNDQLAAAGMSASEELTPAVSRFLGALFDAVVGYEKSQAARMKDTDSSALANIDNLARTINFIAINASVEAARAGDAGKGFAVIAMQIRELSQQSADAVEQIRSELA